MTTPVLDSEQQEEPFAETENRELLLLLQFGHNAAPSSLAQNSSKTSQTQDISRTTSEEKNTGQRPMKAYCQPQFEKLCIGIHSDDTRLSFQQDASRDTISVDPGQPFHINVLPSDQVQMEEEHANEQNLLLSTDNTTSELARNPYVELIRAYFEEV